MRSVTTLYSTEEEKIALAAAEWYFRLQDSSSADNQAACKVWRTADPRHEQAWLKAQYIAQQIASVPPEIAMPTLVNRHRRKAIQSLALLLCVPVTGSILWQSAPADIWLADKRTATGERRQHILEDGTQIYLNTATAADITYSSQHRYIRLHTGEILVETVSDQRPMTVQTRHGSVSPLGTRFTLRDYPHYSRVTVYEGAVKIHTAGSGLAVRIDAGQQTSFSTHRIEAVETADPHGEAWVQGLLVVRDITLVDFITELARYRPGMLRCAPEVAQLRISGAYQLHNTDEILAGLARALPVKVVYFSRYWVTLHPL